MHNKNTLMDIDIADYPKSEKKECTYHGNPLLFVLFRWAFEIEIDSIHTDSKNLFIAG